MKTNEIDINNRVKIKIKLDYKTTITVLSRDAYKMWKEKYPKAIIID